MIWHQQFAIRFNSLYEMICTDILKLIAKRIIWTVFRVDLYVKINRLLANMWSFLNKICMDVIVLKILSCFSLYSFLSIVILITFFVDIGFLIISKTRLSTILPQESTLFFLSINMLPHCTLTWRQIKSTEHPAFFTLTVSYIILLRYLSHQLCGNKPLILWILLRIIHFLLSSIHLLIH